MYARSFVDWTPAIDPKLSFVFAISMPLPPLSWKHQRLQANWLAIDLLSWSLLSGRSQRRNHNLSALEVSLSPKPTYFLYNARL